MDKDNGVKSIAKSGMKSLLQAKESRLATYRTGEITPEWLLSKKFVHFVFNLQGQVSCVFSPHYKRDLPTGEYFLIYDQEKDLPITLETLDARVVYMAVSPDLIHNTFLADSLNPVSFKFEGFGVRDYSVKDIGFEADQILSALFNQNPSTNLVHVYYKAKIIEILSHIFDEPNHQLYEACPFLKEKDNVEKIKEARQILIDRMDDPPSLKDLAKQIGMNEYNLKIGFKNVYGVPPFRYLQDYKLTYSQYLLREGQMQVNEVAYAIGYKSASHYIEAFRKKFGSTPRKFISSGLND